MNVFQTSYYLSYKVILKKVNIIRQVLIIYLISEYCSHKLPSKNLTDFKDRDVILYHIINPSQSCGTPLS